MTVLGLILLLVLLLLLKGFFSGSEIALVNSDKVKLTARANQGDRGSKEVLELFKTPDVMLGTTLVGTNIATVALTTIVTLLFVDGFGDKGEFLAFLVFTPILLILGEIVPKSIFQQKSDELAPLAIEPEWDQLILNYETASTVVPGDEQSMQTAVAMALQSEQAGARVKTWLVDNCALDIGPVATLAPQG